MRHSLTSRPLRSFAVALVVALVVAGGAPAAALAGGRATATPAAAAPYLERGLQLYANGRYAEALVELRRGFAVAPHPDFLYAIGQAERLNGNCAGALESYRAYLRTQPPEPEAARTRQQIDRCEKEAVAATLATLAAPPATKRGFGFTGAALTAGGALSLGAGAWLLVVGGRHAATADDAYTVAERDRERGTARNFRIAGGVAIAGGLALGTLAVMRFLHREDARERSATTLTASAGADHVFVGAAGTF